MRIAQLRRHPVKAMAGEVLDEVEVDQRGLVGDRWYAVVDGDGRFASGKDGRRFRRREAVLDHAAVTTSAGVRVIGPLGSWVVGDPGLDDALGALMGAPVRVLPEAGGAPHQDDGAVSLVGTATLDWCREHLGVDADVRRLRANLLVATDEPFVEETWLGSSVQVGRGRAAGPEPDGALPHGRRRPGRPAGRAGVPQGARARARRVGGGVRRGAGARDDPGRRPGAVAVSAPVLVRPLVASDWPQVHALVVAGGPGRGDLRAGGAGRRAGDPRRSGPASSSSWRSTATTRNASLASPRRVPTGPPRAATSAPPPSWWTRRPAAGVGRTLGEHVVAWHRDAGFAAIQFNAVVASNTAAVALWRSLGFAVVGRVPGAFRRPGGELADLLVMHLDLAGAT